MSIYKRDIVNFLFLISFPFFGIGTYVSAVGSPSAGYLVSVAPHGLIILFYLIDILYKGEFRIRLNGWYFLMLAFIMSTIISMFIALAKGLPEDNLAQTITRSIMLLLPFHSFLMVVLYNEEEGMLLKLTLQSLSLLLFVNLVGYFGLGMSNGTHSIEGRLNFPFLDGFYSGAGLLAVINLMLLHYLRKTWNDPVRFAGLAAYFMFNLAMFLMINSRLAILIFIMVLGLSLAGMIRIRGLFLLSLFTIPILLSSGILLYNLLQLPGLSSLMQRVDIQDVTTFNGRSYLWQDGMDWLLKDQRGLMWGNGYKGHYFMDLISDVAKMWNEKDAFHMHLHSTSMEILVCQGIVFFLVFVALFYGIYVYARRKHKAGKPAGAFLPVVLFLLFIMQVDTFLYLDSLGYVIFSLLVSRLAIVDRAQQVQGIRITEEEEDSYLHRRAPHEWGAAAIN